MTRPFVILDRDGTVIFERNYLSNPEQVELIPGAAAGLKALSELGLGLIVITNQSGIGRGYFDEVRLDEIHERMCQLLNAEGVLLTAILHCPHRPEDDCKCRKPKPGLVWQAAEKYAFEPRHCFVIGDKPCDIDMGKAIDATTILVRTGYGKEFATHPEMNCNFIVDDILQAADVIKSQLTQSSSPYRVSNHQKTSFHEKTLNACKGARDS